MDEYKCRRCGHTFPKKGASISGWEGSASNPPHIHCPKCGHLVAVL